MKENVIDINRGIMINVDVSVINVMFVRNIIIGILLHVIVKIEKIQQGLWIIRQLRVMKLQSYNEKTKTNFNEKKEAYKTQHFSILLAFLLIAIAILIAVGVYCYLIRHQTKQKHLLPFHHTKLKQVNMNNIN